MQSEPIEKRSSFITLAIVCFGVLGGLTGRRVEIGSLSIPTFGVGGSEVIPIAAFALGGVIYAWIGLAVLGRLLYVFNRKVRKQHGYSAIKNAMGNGFLLLLPFTVLALVAELYLGWNAVQAFTAAGIMTGGATAGMELAKAGSGKLAGMILPSLGAFVLSGAWMLLTTLAQQAWKGLM